MGDDRLGTIGVLFALRKPAVNQPAETLQQLGTAIVHPPAMALEMHGGSFISSGDEFRGMVEAQQKQESAVKSEQSPLPDTSDITRTLLQALLDERKKGRQHHHHHHRHGHHPDHQPYSWRLERNEEESEDEPEKPERKMARHDDDKDVFDAHGHAQVKEEAGKEETGPSATGTVEKE